MTLQYYSQRNLEEQINELIQNIKELMNEREIYQKNFDIIKRNWSGDEYNKAEAKLIAMGKTLDMAINDLIQQKRFLQEKNERFISANVGRIS